MASCGEKFHHLHQWPKRQFNLILGDDEVTNRKGEEDLECRTLSLCWLFHGILDDITTMWIEGILKGSQ